MQAKEVATASLPPIRYSTSTAEVAVLDPENFIENVINSVTSSAVDGFNYMEQFAAERLDPTIQEHRSALKEGVDSIFYKVQDNVDESLMQWESICRHRYFNVSDALGTDNSMNGILSSINDEQARNDVRSSSIPTRATSADRSHEDALDSELSSIRSRIIVARKDGARMRKEIDTLEKKLALRREISGEVKSIRETFDDAAVEDVIQSAALLRETIVQAKALQDITSGHQTRTLLEDSEEDYREPGHLVAGHGDLHIRNLLS